MAEKRSSFTADPVPDRRKRPPAPGNFRTRSAARRGTKVGRARKSRSVDGAAAPVAGRCRVRLRFPLDRPALVDVVRQLRDEAGGLEDDVHAVSVSRQHRIDEGDLIFRARYRNVEETALLLEPLV